MELYHHEFYHAILWGNVMGLMGVRPFAFGHDPHTQEPGETWMELTEEWPPMGELLVFNLDN